MSFFKGLSRRKRKGVVDEKLLHQSIQQELGGYLKREELHEYLEKIKRDERKRELWDSLSNRKKIRILRHVLTKKEVHNGKK